MPSDKAFQVTVKRSIVIDLSEQMIYDCTKNGLLRFLSGPNFSASFHTKGTIQTPTWTDASPLYWPKGVANIP